MIEAASANSSAVRTGVLVNSAGETVASGEFASGLTYKKMTIPEAGDYWFYSTDSGINCLLYTSYAIIATEFDRFKERMFSSIGILMQSP